MVSRLAGQSSLPVVIGERARRLTLSEKTSLLYVASVPFDGMDVGGRSLPFVVGGAYLTVATLERLGRGRRAEKAAVPISRTVPTFLFTVWCMASSLWSLTPDVTLTRTWTLLVLLVTSWFLAHDLSRVSEAVPVAFGLGSCPLALFVLAAPAAIDSRRTANGNANDVAMMLLLGVACALWVSLSRRGGARWLGIGMMPVLIVGVVATGSRTAVLGGAAMLVTVALRFAWKRQWRRLVLMSVLVGLGVWLFPNVPETVIPERLGSTLQDLQEGELSNRTYIWEAILERGLDVTGIGAGAGPAYLRAMAGTASVAHNVVLGVLLAQGRESLARRSANDDVRLRHLFGTQPVLDCAGIDQTDTERRLVRCGGRRLHLDGSNR